MGIKSNPKVVIEYIAVMDKAEEHALNIYWSFEVMLMK